MTILSTAAAQAEPPPAACNSKTVYTPCGAGGGHDFGVGVGRPSPGSTSKPGGGSTHSGTQPSVHSDNVLQKTFEPACTGNTPDAGGALCGTALGSCPAPNDIAYWLFTRTLNTVTGVTTPWQRVYDPPILCFGPSNPPPAPIAVEVIIQAIINRDWQSTALPRGVIDVRPRSETLVNVPTHFSTSTGSQTLPPLTVLGRRVVISATAERYDWSMGDGTSYLDGGPGSAEAPLLHTYRRAATVTPSVTITWSGTFRIAGDAQTYRITGTATSLSFPVGLAVRAAHSELVAR